MAGTLDAFLQNPKRFIFGDSADTLTAELAAKNSRISELEATISKHASDLASATQPIAALTARAEKAEGDLLAAQSSLTAEIEKLKGVTARAEKAEATISDPKGEIQRLASVKSAEILASAGHKAPIADVTGSTKGTPAGTEKLTGLARAIAIHKAETDQKTATKGVA